MNTIQSINRFVRWNCSIDFIEASGRFIVFIDLIESPSEVGVGIDLLDIIVPIQGIEELLELSDRVRIE